MMKFILNQIKRDTVNGPLTFDKVVDLTELESMENDIRKIKPVRVQGECDIDGDEIIFTLNISGEMILPCARTLTDVPYPFDINEVEVFSTSAYYGKEEIENEIYPVEGEVLDLTPRLLENILLAIPFRVITEDEEVLKSAIYEGDGWELSFEEDEEEKEQQDESIDPRLQKLQSLLDKNEKEK